MPATGCNTVPAVAVPSPQLMSAVKSPGTLLVLVSVKVATVPLKFRPWMAAIPSGCGVRTSPSVTVTVPVGLIWSPSLVRVMVTTAWSLPSSA